MLQNFTIYIQYSIVHLCSHSFSLFWIPSLLLRHEPKCLKFSWFLGSMLCFVCVYFWQNVIYEKALGQVLGWGSNKETYFEAAFLCEVIVGTLKMFF